jgi:hypothetical protein
LIWRESPAHKSAVLPVRKLSSRGGGDAQGLHGTGHVVAEVDVFITGFLSSFPVFR